jgi:hypothetical protein
MEAVEDAGAAPANRPRRDPRNPQDGANDVLSEYVLADFGTLWAQAESAAILGPEMTALERREHALDTMHGLFFDMGTSWHIQNARAAIFNKLKPTIQTVDEWPGFDPEMRGNKWALTEYVTLLFQAWLNIWVGDGAKVIEEEIPNEGDIRNALLVVDWWPNKWGQEGNRGLPPGAARTIRQLEAGLAAQKGALERVENSVSRILAALEGQGARNGPGAAPGRGGGRAFDPASLSSEDQDMELLGALQNQGTTGDQGLGGSAGPRRDNHAAEPATIPQGGTGFDLYTQRLIEVIKALQAQGTGTSGSPYLIGGGPGSGTKAEKIHLIKDHLPKSGSELSSAPKRGTYVNEDGQWESQEITTKKRLTVPGYFQAAKAIEEKVAKEMVEAGRPPKDIEAYKAEHAAHIGQIIPLFDKFETQAVLEFDNIIRIQVNEKKRKFGGDFGNEFTTTFLGRRLLHDPTVPSGGYQPQSMTRPPNLRGGAGGGPKGNAGGRRPCSFYQQQGGCREGDACRFPHTCTKCGEKGHGAAFCKSQAKGGRGAPFGPGGGGHGSK